MGKAKNKRLQQKTEAAEKAGGGAVSTLANAKITMDGKIKLSTARRKKLAKSKRKALQMSWCWYCEREFEDDKVLLQHQKARHFKCPHCPRRLNTAGGLAVHIDQVHKLGTDRIENTIPGRDSFDIEIYGMEGVPAADLREWRQKKEIEAGVNVNKVNALKPKIDKTVISQEDFKRQLQAHKDLMEGKVAPSVAVNAFQGGPMMPMAPQMPFPPSMPGMPMPPPGLPMPPLGMPFPPPGMPLPPGGFPMPPPGMPMPPGFPGFPGIGQPPQAPAAAQPAAIPSSKVTLKPGQVLLYGDNDTSPEEKRATLPKYKVKSDDIAEPAMSADGPVGARKSAADLM